MRNQNNKLDIHGLWTNLYKANKYFLYYKELIKEDYKTVRDKYPLVGDAQQTFYFRAILHLCNFLRKREHLYLGRILEVITDEENSKRVSASIKVMETDPHFENLFNLRDKWIGHRDNDWYLSSQIFPDETFERFLMTIKDILEMTLGIIPPIPYDQDLLKSANFLTKMKQFE